MQKLLFCIFLVCFLKFCYGFFLCESPGGKLEKLKVSGCSDLNDTCHLPRNTNVTVTIKFTPTICVETLKFIPSAVLTDYNVDLKVLNSNACASCGISCPLPVNVTQTYSSLLPIMGYYPPGLFLLQLELKSGCGVDIVCVGIFAEVK